MTIDEMIEELEDARQEMGGDTEIAVAYQETYPLRGTVARVTVPEKDDMCPGCGENRDHDEDECPGGAFDSDSKDRELLWLAIGSADYRQSPYAPHWPWEG